LGPSMLDLGTCVCVCVCVCVNVCVGGCFFRGFRGSVRLEVAVLGYPGFLFLPHFGVHFEVTGSPRPMWH
jgi:hypothetical protein